MLKGQCQQFPWISQGCSNLLSATANQCPLERLFSLAGEVITDHCAKLTPDNAEKLIFLKIIPL
jgi:hAT family C-terminal dimerisation region